MLLAPKKTKFKKIRKGSFRTRKLNLPDIKFGGFGIVALESGYIHAKQLEASRQTINRHLSRKGKIRNLVFPSLGVSQKPLQVRMGKGVGKTKNWVYRTNPGKTIFEVSGIIKDDVKDALISGVQKLPIKIKIVLK